jgi:hypothetical protein
VSRGFERLSKRKIRWSAVEYSTAFPYAILFHCSLCLWAGETVQAVVARSLSRMYSPAFISLYLLWPATCSGKGLTSAS